MTISKYTFYGIIVFLIVLAIWLLFWILGVNRNDPGQFGDMFGSVNALFSGLAFGGIILTIILQNQELRLQRTELSQTRQEIHNQNKTLRRQRFENTFFNLIRVHNDIITGLDTEYSIEVKDLSSDQAGLKYLKKPLREPCNGRDYFEQRYNDLKSTLLGFPEQSKEAYELIFKLSQNDLGHYFRHLYRIFKYIDETDFITIGDLSDDEEINIRQAVIENEMIRYEYASIIRAQLSNYELLFLFYNCLSDHGKGFKYLVEKYSILNNMPQEELHAPGWKSMYEESAYSRGTLSTNRNLQ